MSVFVFFLLCIIDLVVFGCVVVLFGGSFSECEVLFDFGCNVIEVLCVCGVDVIVVDGILVLVQVLVECCFDCVFNIFYGYNGGGEDGIVQGLMEVFVVLYIGLDVFGLVLSMDKICIKQVWLVYGLLILCFVLIGIGVDVYVVVCEFGLLVVVKLVNEGFSVGISWVIEELGLDEVVVLVVCYDGQLLMEQMVVGDELIVVIFGDVVLLLICIVFKGQWYDYNVKYIVEDIQYLCLGLEGEDEIEIWCIVLVVFCVVGCSGWGCVDVMCDCSSGCFYLFEVNIVLGMISYLLVLKVVCQVGIDFEELVWCVLEQIVEVCFV